jgi:hypothetical protein
MKWMASNERHESTLTEGMYWLQLWSPKGDDRHYVILRLPKPDEWWVAPNTGTRDKDIGPLESFDKARTIAEMLIAQEGGVV